MKPNSQRIGYMQGRLSPLVEGRVQAFPWTWWQAEFPAAQSLGLSLMEWTLDQDRLYENPLLTSAGQAEIRDLCRRHGLSIASLTGDCFMQAPFWKAQGATRKALQNDFSAIASACAAVGIEIIVVPLVDNGSLENADQEGSLIDFLTGQIPTLLAHGIRVAFECDFVPAELTRFIARLPAPTFGVNYDIGNSAALGFDPAEELAAYGERVINVHIKDRVLNGTTVALGTGAAKFDTVFKALAGWRYRGNYILQTARAADGDHAAALRSYRDMAVDWLDRYGA